ncbi:ATP-binding cassette domain-containing protein, partial [Verminephrobacter sp. Larva24]
MPELLRIEGLSAGYGQAVVLQDIALTLPEGQTLALLGRNGAGKTTLIDTLAGATRQHAGTIHLGGVALHPLPAHQRAAAGIGWVPQERNIFASLTVHENLTAVARPARASAGTGEAAGTDASAPARPWTPERVYDLFPRLAERKTHLGTQLSGGEQQMLAVGRALVLNPRLLLLDEPSSGLNVEETDDMAFWIQDIQQALGITVLMVEHDMALVSRVSDRVLAMNHGQVLAMGSPREVQSHPGVIEAYL